MTHYICSGGCNGELDIPGVCRAEGCRNEGQPLVECNCTDETHKDRGEDLKEVQEENILS